MANEPTIDKLGWVSIILVLTIFGFGVSMWLGGDSATSTPDLYELSRQTAENTRWIFWVLVVGVIELGCLLAFVMFKKN